MPSRQRATVAALLLVLVGCGGSGSGGRPITVLAGEATAATKTLRVSTSSQNLGADGRPVGPDTTATGIVDLTRHRLRMDMPPEDSSIACVPAPCATPVPQPVGASPAATTVVIGPDQWELDAGPGGFNDGIAPPGKWLHLRRGAGAGAAVASQYDPARWFAYLGASDHVERLGRAVVRGVSTVHYRFTLRPRATTTTDAAFGEKVSFEAWVSDDHLVRRLRMTIHLETLADGRTTSTTSSAFTMELYDFGVAADIEPPPAADVVEVPPCGTTLPDGVELSCGTGHR